MKLTLKAKMAYGAQDGAFWGDYMFRFNADGRCRVFDAKGLDAESAEPVDLALISEFAVNPAEPVIPHFNAVVFGSEYFADGDEFPLLYANIYNNYAKQEDRREGMCCVYRLLRDNTAFSMTLVQIIKIGFVEDRQLWKSNGEKPDVRPYGNFVIDTEKNLLHAFTMRDATHTTRYFSFDLPKLADGVVSEEYGVRLVTLGAEDIRDYFDTEYHLFIQGACCHKGKIYSSEGFNADVPPALRVIDPEKKEQLLHINLPDLGYTVEAEWIDFRNDICYYSDAKGNIFEADFELK
ncbi:MAG: hypothetical protein IJ493_13555 [Clostridia bacterium]|nr:hypothetical protein [Clostridia bacterium]